MSPPARTSASSSRNSVGVRASDRLADTRLVTARLEHELAGGQRPAAARRPARPLRSTRRMTAAIRASSSALPNGLVR